MCLTFCVYLSIKVLYLLSYLLTFLMHIVDLVPVREFFPPFLSPFGLECKPICLYVPPGCHQVLATSFPHSSSIPAVCWCLFVLYSTVLA